MFAALADRWWDVNGPFRPLHQINFARLGLLREQIAAHFGPGHKNGENSREINELMPFHGLKILDIGCGGGLIAEPMARLGAEVTAIDTVGNNIKAAELHAAQSGLSIHYRLSSSSELYAEARQSDGVKKDGTNKNGGKFDVVLALEVIEHVNDPARFVEEISALVRPGGMMVFSTLNRNLRSYAMAIIGAEYILRWLPPGTHDWRKFIPPASLAAWLRRAEVGNLEFFGLSYNMWQRQWVINQDLRVNYFVIAKKTG